MAVGDLVTTYNQYEFNGILMGHGTDYIMSKVEGLYGKSDIKTTDYDRMDAWGEFPGRNMYKGRTITLTVDCIGLPDPAAQNPIQQNYDALMAALALPDLPGQLNPYEFVHYRPWTVPGKRFVYTLPQKVAVTSDFNWVLGHFQAVIALKANDPRHYALTPVVDTLTLASGASQVSESCQNNGDAWGTPIFTMEFTLTNQQWTTMNGQTTTYLTVENASTGNQAIILPLSAIAGAAYPTNGTITLAIDFRQMTITSNGVDISGQMNASSTFWKLQPGSNTLVVTSGESFPVNATIQIQHNDTWSG